MNRTKKKQTHILCALPDDEARALDLIAYILRETLPGVYADVKTITTPEA